MENKILIDSVNNLKVALNEISVYDFDVYTSMELYYKIAENFNKVIRELSKFEGVISEEIVKQNEKLIYLLGDGLNQEVVNKIDNMIETGVFDTIINHNIFNNLKNDINNVNIDMIKVKMIAHRGFSWIAPENTIPAYELASEYGFWGGECDVAETADGEFVLMHDVTIDRTTTGSGRVSDFTLKELKEFNIDVGNNIDNYPDLKIPTLEEFLSVCKKNNLIPIIEVKSITDSNIDSFLNKINKYGFINKTIIISFNYDLLKKIRLKNNSIIIQALLDLTIENINKVKALGVNSHIDCEHGTVTKELVELAHQNGILVNTWTVNNKEVVKNLINMGVDFITTDNQYDPETLDYKIKNIVNVLTPIANQLNNIRIGASSTIIGKTYDELISDSDTSNRCSSRNKFFKSGNIVYINVPSGYKITLMPFDSNGLYLRDYGWMNNGEKDISGHVDVSYYHLYFAKIDGSNFNDDDLKILKENVTIVFKNNEQSRKYNFLIQDSSIKQLTSYTSNTCNLSYDGDDVKTFSLSHSIPIAGYLPGISFGNVSATGDLNIEIRTKGETINGLKFLFYEKSTNKILTESEVLTKNLTYFNIIHMV